MDVDILWKKGSLRGDTKEATKDIERQLQRKRQRNITMALQGEMGWEDYATTGYADDTGDSWQEPEWDYNQAEQDWWIYDDQFGTSDDYDTTHDISGINERLVIGHYEDKNQAYYYRNASNSAHGSNRNRCYKCLTQGNNKQQHQEELHYPLLDPGASTHVCPRDYAPDIPLRPCAATRNRQNPCLRNQVRALPVGQLQGHDSLLRL